MDDKELLIRMDERLKNIEDSMDNLVRKDEFLPVKLIAFGLIGASTIGLLSAIMSGVLV